MPHFVVKNLIRRPPREPQNFPAALSVRITKKIFSLVDKSLAVDVDHDAVGIGIAVLIGRLDVRRLGIHQNGVTSTPMAGGLRAKSESEVESFPRVVAGASHLHQIPARSEIPGAHFRISFKTSGGHYHRVAAQISYAVSGLYSHSGDCSLLIGQEARRFGFI